ncbi:MAG: GntR family transcriptional regulator [Verrucomicrobia bacterium]|nr:GntR family transcriptional regulator [Verrucomicrobiota bacterium]
MKNSRRNTSKNSFPGRLKYVSLAQSIQADIESGKFSPGDKLPSEINFARQHEVAYLTARNALTLLAKKGLISREHRRGTFVRHAHNKKRIAVLCEVSLKDETAYFYRALIKALSAEFEGQALVEDMYDGRSGVSEDEDWQRSHAFQRFRADHSNCPFDGVIAISLPEDWEHPAILTSLPSARLNGYYAQPDVSLDYADFTSRSLSFLNDIGRRNIVYLRTLPELAGQMADLEGISRAVQELAIPEPRIEQLIESQRSPEGGAIERSAYQKTLELIEGKIPLATLPHPQGVAGRVISSQRRGIAGWKKKTNRPDALIISDDIGARGVAMALLKRGVRVPTDVTLLSFATEGIEHHYGIPVAKYEISLAEVARTLARILQQRMEDPAVEIQPRRITGQIKTGKEKENEIKPANPSTLIRNIRSANVAQGTCANNV